METILITLYSILSVAVIVLTVFISLAMYRLIRVLRNAEYTLTDINRKLAQVDTAVDSVSTTIKTVSASIGQIKEYVLEPIVGFMKGVNLAGKVIKTKLKDKDN